MPLTRRTFTPKDVALPKPAPLTSCTDYGKCMECGTEEGAPCFDVNDKPLKRICDGRTLSSKVQQRREARRSNYRIKGKKP
jgi:hypothetical protein